MMDSERGVWDAVAAGYDAERAHDGTYARCVHAAHRALYAQGVLARVLDIGCGTGLSTQPLCRKGRIVIAADYSMASLRVLRDKHCGCALAQADISSLPFEDGQFDAVLCANTLQHLAPVHQRCAVSELRRVLAPTGVLVITVHHYSRQKAARGWIKEGKPGQPGIDYIFRFTRKELSALVPDADIRAVGLKSRFEMFFPPPLTRTLARIGYGHMLMALVPNAGRTTLRNHPTDHRAPE